MFKTHNGVVKATGGRVVEITVKLVAEDAEGDVLVTDLMLQGGKIGTKWSGHPSEIKWAVDG